MRKTIDPDNAELKSILDALLAEDITISARKVAERHSCLNDASAFTRSEARKAIIASYVQRQLDARALKNPPKLSENDQLTQRLEQKTDRVAELEEQVKHLVASHLGVIRAVQNTGGWQSLERFWSEYKAVADAVHAAGAVPAPAQVVSLPKRS